MVKNNGSQVYRWNIETEIGVFTGSCLDLIDVNQEIAILKDKARILKMNINMMTIKNEQLKNKIYSWNVTTINGEASGLSSSLEEAKRVLNSFGSSEIIEYNIVETFSESKIY
jgi:hypothetical protein